MRKKNTWVLKANGKGCTYSLITDFLAPGFNPIEVPDCGHLSFGNHIDEIYDDTLNGYAFRFHIHVNDDNDRCIEFDRQRNEIKAYGRSPKHLISKIGDTVTYKWKFKLPYGFQSSPEFTHIHQLKPSKGSNASTPMYTLTTRKTKNHSLELQYAGLGKQVTLSQTDLTPFIGRWIQAEETVTYAIKGSYSIKLKDYVTQELYFNYSNSDIDNWRPEARVVNPKWGIYRSLNYSNYLRDEQVLLADISFDVYGRFTH